MFGYGVDYRSRPGALAGLWLKLLVAGMLLVGLLQYSMLLQAREMQALPSIQRNELPLEARQTLQRIEIGGPFRFERDGIVFGNYERRLPQQPRGYYREYTVLTPGERNRGARRIIWGCATQAATPAQCRGNAFFYTDDHYRSFSRVQD